MSKYVQSASEHVDRVRGKIVNKKKSICMSWPLFMSFFKNKGRISQ